MFQFARRSIRIDGALPARGALYSFAVGSALRRTVTAMVMAVTTAVTGVTVSALASPALGGGVIYVDASAPLGGDGQSWATAKRYLVDGIAAADASGVDEVRVAQGVYKPDQKEVDPPIGDRTVSFVLHDGLTLRGGYAGLSGSDPDAWDPWTFTTVLSGDLLGDDGQPGGGISDNSLRIVHIESVAVVLSGFTITGGNANGTGTSALGSAIRAADASFVIEHCRIVGNRSGRFGVVWLQATGESAVRDCVLEGNSERAMSANGVAPLVIERCDFIGNHSPAAHAGPALGVTTPADAPHLVELRECRFLDNTTAGPAGAISGTRFLLIDSLLAGNSALSGGALLTTPGSLAVVGSVFVDNKAEVGGGGVFVTPASAERDFVSCVFMRNAQSNSLASGGAVYFTSKGRLMNSLVFENSSGTFGGGVATSSSPLVSIDHVTLSVNLPNGLEIASGVTVTHSVDWGNASPGVNVYAGSPIIRQSLIEGGWSGSGDGNISADPLFVAPDSGDFRLLEGSPAIDAGLIELLPMEPIDLDGDGILGPLPFDLLGAPRVQGAAPDLGAFEGAGTPMIPMAATKELAPGETAVLVPENSLPWAPPPVVAEITNIGADAIDATLAEIGWTKHPATAGFSEDGLIGELSVKAAAGAHRTRIRVPIGPSHLTSFAALSSLRPTVWDQASQTWRRAPALNSQPSPGHSGPIGDFFVDLAFEYDVPPLSDELGDHGVFWSFGESKGFVWANVDVSGDFGVGSKLCAPDLGPLDGDGVVDGVDLGILLNAWGGNGAGDINQDGVVDGKDLALLIASWGLCEGFTPPGGGEGGLAGGDRPTWPRGESMLAADLNGDGVIDGTDLGLLLVAWGECPQSFDGAGGCPDLNGDGVIDGADLGLLLVAWESMRATR